jgi:hypothetical protein
MRNVSDKRFMFSNFLFKKRAVCMMYEKYFTTGQATDDNMAHAHCLLDT